jgi:hypothetical protein
MLAHRGIRSAEPARRAREAFCLDRAREDRHADQILEVF